MNDTSTVPSLSDYFNKIFDLQMKLLDKDSKIALLEYEVTLCRAMLNVLSGSKKW